MSTAIVPRKPQLRLADPAELQHPLTFYAHILAGRWLWITLLSLSFTALVILVCAFMPPVYVGSSVIAIDRQVAPEAVGDNRPLNTGDDQFMATQQRLLTALDAVFHRFSEHRRDEAAARRRRLAQIDRLDRRQSLPAEALRQRNAPIAATPRVDFGFQRRRR